MKPISLRMKNFFSHKDSEIDFTGIDSCLLVGNIEGDYSKSNGSGKSAVFEAIPWVLYNFSRSSSRNDNIKWGEDECRVELVFSHRLEKYKIIRERFRKTSTSSVYFFKENALGEWTDLTRETATETNKYISDVLGMDYKTFLNTVYFRQNDISEFSEGTPERKKEIIKNIVEIGRWDAYQKKVKDKLKEFKIKNEIISEELESFELLEQEFVSAKDGFKEEKERLSSIEKLKSKYQKEYKSCLEKYLLKESSLDTNLFDKTIEKISYFSDMITKNEEIIMKEKVSFDDVSKKYNDINSKCEAISMKIEAYVEEPNLEDKISDAASRLLDFKSELRFKTESAKVLKNKEYSSGFCDHCSQRVDEDHIKNVKESDSKTLDSLLGDIENLKALINSVSEEKLSYEINLKERGRIESLKEKLSSGQERANFFSTLLETTTNSIESSQARLEDFMKKKKEQVEILESLKDSDFSNLKEMLSSAKEKLDSIESEELSVIKNIGAYEQSIKNINERVEFYKEKKKELLSVSENIEVYSKAAKYLGRTGIQTILLNNFIEDLEDETNKVVKSMGIPFGILMETQSIASNGTIKETLDIRIRKDGNYHGFESLSGGEKAKVALSLRFALSSLATRYGGGDFEFMMLDEINSPLDRDGVENLMVSVVKTLEENLLVLMITHDEGLKESFDNIIEVTKVNGESSVNIIKT